MGIKGSAAGENIALIAGTILATLALQRHLSSFARAKPETARNSYMQVALEVGDHGRSARTPWEIPWNGWKDILLRTYEQISEDRLTATAAGVVFYGLLAIFPAITALVSSYGLFADPSTVSQNLQALALMFPEGSFAIVQDQIGRVLADRWS
jgi:membrane protein